MIFVKTRKQYIRTWSSSVVADHKNADSPTPKAEDDKLAAGTGTLGRR